MGAHSKSSEACQVNIGVVWTISNDLVGSTCLCLLYCWCIIVHMYVFSQNMNKGVIIILNLCEGNVNINVVEYGGYREWLLI